MQLSPSTSKLLTSIDSFSGSKLVHREDLGKLIELAARQTKESTLDELSFFAKFISRAYTIMKRIGKEGEGYDRIEEQFNDTLEKAITLARALLEGAPVDVQRHFTVTYFGMTTTSLTNLLDLFYDLSWYKNWLIDHPEMRQ